MRPPIPESKTPIGRGSIGGDSRSGYAGAMRRALVVLAAALSVSVVAPATAGAATKQDLTIRMSDGVDLAATLFTPDETPLSRSPR